MTHGDIFNFILPLTFLFFSLSLGSALKLWPLEMFLKLSLGSAPGLEPCKHLGSLAVHCRHPLHCLGAVLVKLSPPERWLPCFIVSVGVRVRTGRRGIRVGVRVRVRGIFFVPLFCFFSLCNCLADCGRSVCFFFGNSFGFLSNCIGAHFLRLCRELHLLCCRFCLLICFRLRFSFYLGFLFSLKFGLFFSLQSGFFCNSLESSLFFCFLSCLFFSLQLCIFFCL